MKKVFWIFTVIVVLAVVLAVINMRALSDFYKYSEAQGEWNISLHNPKGDKIGSGKLNLSIKRWDTAFGFRYPPLEVKPRFEEKAGDCMFNQAGLDYFYGSGLVKEEYLSTLKSAEIVVINNDDSGPSLLIGTKNADLIMACFIIIDGDKITGEPINVGSFNIRFSAER